MATNNNTEPKLIPKKTCSIMPYNSTFELMVLRTTSAFSRTFSSFSTKRPVPSLLTINLSWLRTTGSKLPSNSSSAFSLSDASFELSLSIANATPIKSRISLSCSCSLASNKTGAVSLVTVPIISFTAANRFFLSGLLKFKRAIAARSEIRKRLLSLIFLSAFLGSAPNAEPLSA